ncbi:MAG: TonB-dependent receptor, partial [Vicinamibacterales bacterium]
HDFKVGYDIKRDRRSLFRDQPFDIFYRDRGTALSQVEIYNSDVTGINDVVNQAGWINDTWKITNRLTATLGLRFEHYRDGWPDQEFAPNGLPGFENFNDARYQDFVAPRTVSATTVATTNTLAPRVGFAYDLTGDNRTVVKAYFGQSRWNSADTLSDLENPVGLARLRYAFLDCTATRTTGCDLNGNRLLDSPAELGAFNSTQGGAGFVRIDRGIIRPKSNELSTNLERELLPGLSARVSYVYKNMRDVWAESDTLRNGAFTVPFTINDPGADNVRGTADDQTFQTFDRPQAIGQDRVYTNPDGTDADFQTVEFALNRRFRDRWMLLTSFGHTWSKMQHYSTTTPTGYTRDYSFRPADRLFGDEFGRETSTTWNYKIIGRYEMPWGIGSSGSWRVQSGQNYGRTINVAFPGDGARTVRVEPIDANRYPNISIFDLRLDKSFTLPRQAGKVTVEFDGFNLLNSGAITAFRTTTVNYREVTELLAPRIFRVGFRWDF